MADNQSNAKPVVQQRHPGDEFPVLQRGSTKGKQSVPVLILLMDLYLYRKKIKILRMLFCQLMV